MKTPYFALYPTDFLADTGHLGNTELGIYWRLLLVYYRDQRPLPFDTDRLRRLAMCFSPEECRALEAVMAEFFALTTETDGTRVWRHRRADVEIERASAAYGNKVEGARKAREARAAKTKTDNSSDVRPDIKPVSTGEPEPEPEPEKEKRKAAAQPGATAPSKVPQLTVDDLTAEGVSPEVAVEFMALRHRLKAPLTPLAWRGLKREAGKAGWSLDDALTKCVARKWQGFEASWVESRHARASPQAEPDWRREARERAQALGGAAAVKTPVRHDFIDVEATDVTPPTLG